MIKINDIEIKFKLINKFIWILYIVLGIGIGVYNIFYSTLYYIILSLVSPFFLVIPYLIYFVLNLKTVYTLNFAIYLFSFFSYTVGVVFNAYSLIPYYDKIIHTLAGVFFSWMGMGFYYVLKSRKEIEKNDYSLVAFFSIFFSAFIAIIWEIYEYLANFILKTDPQRVITSGVNDTMQDMILCVLGSFIMWIFIYLYYKKNKPTFLMSVFEIFFNINIKDKSNN